MSKENFCTPSPLITNGPVNIFERPTRMLYPESIRVDGIRVSMPSDDEICLGSEKSLQHMKGLC
jgi:hypothetical protein